MVDVSIDAWIVYNEKELLRTIFWSSSTFWHSPGDILRRHLDITKLTMNAVLPIILVSSLNKVEPNDTYLRIND